MKDKQGPVYVRIKPSTFLDDEAFPRMGARSGPDDEVRAIRSRRELGDDGLGYDDAIGE